ncbi:MAG TPA: GNAT family N-acetyltransferase [Frankiaceae bacterium]|nr:GNAT family N-acetyltransferase [Frankiaceae bacterium]
MPRASWPSRHPGQVAPSSRPPGYPTAYEQWVELDDGRRVFLRPVVPADAAELGEAIRSADPETLHLRFLGGPPRVTPALLDHLTRVDYVRHFALVARAEDGQGVAIARYVADRDGGSAEVAVAVLPGWRHVRVATSLVRALATRALECGIADFTASFVPENRPVAEIAHEAHARVVVSEGAAMLRANLAEVAGEQAPGPADD